MKQINIACDAPLYLDYKDLNYFQGELKSLSKENYEKLRNEIVETGFAFPIHAWLDPEEKKYWIIGGHQRYRAIKQMVEKEQFESPKLPIVPIHAASKKEARRRILQDVSQYGKIDEQGLYEFAITADIDLEELKKFELPEIDLDKFEANFFDTVEDVEGQDDIPENVPPRTQPGQIYLLGDHKLMCGDSTKIGDVEKLLASHRADMVFTDPPYNVDYEGSDGQKIQNDNMSNEQYLKFCEDFFAVYFAMMKEGAAIYVFHADTEGGNVRNAFIGAGFHLSSCLIWNKSSLIMGRSDYHWKHEPCLYGWKPGAAHHWYSDRTQTTVFDHAKGSGEDNKLHPTSKPVSLVEYYIGNSSAKGDLVLDLFGGSGSTVIACEKTRRRAFVCELDPHYCDIVIARWEQFTGQEAELVRESHSGKNATPPEIDVNESL